MNKKLEQDSKEELWGTIRKSISFIWNCERKIFLFNLFFTGIAAVTVYLQLTSFSGIVNEVVRIQKEGLGITDVLIKQAIYLALTFLIPAITDNWKNRYSAELHTKFHTQFKKKIIDVYSNLDIATVESAEYKTKLAFAQEWGPGSIMNVIRAFIDSFRAIIGLITAGIILYFISPVLVLLAVVGTLPGYWVERKYGYKLYQIFNDQTDDLRVMQDRYSYFNIPGRLIEVLLLNISLSFKKKIIDVRVSHDNQIVKASVEKSFATFFTDIFEMLCLFLAIIVITMGGINGTILIGTLVLAFSSFRGFGSTATGFFYNISQIQDQSRYAKRWFEIMEIKPKVLNAKKALKPVWDKSPKIEFRNVSFQYPGTDKTILNDFSFTIESGEKIAFVGQNGAGKTTTIKLLARVYDPTEGEILIDDINLKIIDIEYWRANLGVLFQDFNNFQMTTAEAIAIARSDKKIDMKKVKWAAGMAGADEFINEFPKKYDQMLWKGFQDGVELSKGQHQRMAVARIFYRDALISVLDEPTASIDAVVEEQIFEALETKMENKTIILISHRFSTVKNADKIIVIEHGKIVEMGNHPTLMQKQGRYSELYTMQANRYLENEEV